MRNDRDGTQKRRCPKGEMRHYRCTGNRAKCDLPRFREEALSDRLGEPLKDLQVPSEVVTQIVDALHKDQEQTEIN